jgi:AbrB family looped-hinge helix DNA binding protein
MLDVSRVTSKGQVTIPVEMRRKLGVKDGDKVVFIEEGYRIVIANAAMAALKEIQEAFSGEAERPWIARRTGYRRYGERSQA